MSVEQTLAERGNRYGDFTDHAKVAQLLQDTMRHHCNAGAKYGSWVQLSAVQRQALTVIADKIARILSGDPNYADNWHDIQGYAKLVEDRLVPQKPEGYTIAAWRKERCKLTPDQCAAVLDGVPVDQVLSNTEPASEIDDDSPRQQAIAQNGNDGAVYAELIANGVKAGHCATCGIDQTQLHYVGCPELEAPPEFQAEVDATISEVFGDPDGWVEWRPAVEDRAPRPSGVVDYITRSGNAYTADSALLDWTHQGSDLDIVQYRPAK